MADVLPFASRLDPLKVDNERRAFRIANSLSFLHKMTFEHQGTMEGFEAHELCSVFELVHAEANRLAEALMN